SSTDNPKSGGLSKELRFVQLDPATPVQQSSQVIKNPHLMPASYSLSKAHGLSVKPFTLGEQAASGMALAAKNGKVKNQKSNSKKNLRKK
ncbi:hypothetical protein FRC11_001182, partial [Ceratobasidium sp. 423]